MHAVGSTRFAFAPSPRGDGMMQTGIDGGGFWPPLLVDSAPVIPPGGQLEYIWDLHYARLGPTACLKRVSYPEPPNGSGP